MARPTRSLGAAIEARQPAAIPGDVDIDPELRDHVVIVGYGRTGRLLAELLDRRRVAHRAVDLDLTRVVEMRARGAPALAVSVIGGEVAESVPAAARRLSRDRPILGRARDHWHAEQLLAQGATQVVAEVLEAGLHLGEPMRGHIGLSSNVTREVVDAERAAALSTNSRKNREDRLGE